MFLFWISCDIVSKSLINFDYMSLAGRTDPACQNRTHYN